MLRLFAILFLFGGVWLGMKLERSILADRCRDAGGQVDPRGLCIGATR
ncbi:hypothetical protein [Rhodovulum marinum]|uniref:Uncharacterized protein n=1 Tax=Rhodovulum marinum TaxID=320662 RepID=A0A4R2PWS5_9RHOB|nr:hypothetical protein [Rhodovulum marinum]TCP40429.1 hypothetical protein EV662_10738 [Rhodovulum marinum]